MTNTLANYFYTPIAYYKGSVLKCKGICTDDNKGWYLEQNPGTVVLAGYRGDRIKADTFEAFDS